MKRAIWIDTQYVILDTGTDDEWYSLDGVDWVNQNGKPVTFPDDVELIDGPHANELRVSMF